MSQSNITISFNDEGNVNIEFDFDASIDRYGYLNALWCLTDLVAKTINCPFEEVVANLYVFNDYQKEYGGETVMTILPKMDDQNGEKNKHQL